MVDAVSVRAHLERFPASVKGAFILRGADGDPHQLRIDSARIADLSGGPATAMNLEPTVLDVAPTLDTFVPFEVPITELASGWYRLECDVAIDGTPTVVRAGDPFVIPWPRGAVRKGTASIRRRAGDVKLVDLNCGADSIRVTYEAERAPRVTMSADGQGVPVLAVDHDEDGGRGTIVGFPVLRTQARLRISVKGTDPVEVALP